MILVFASGHDEHAKALVRRWEARGASLMTPADLSSAGWRCTSSGPGNATFVIGGVQHEASRIRGVLVRWPAVLPSDLPHIVPSDRTYVAAEINAFLVYWFSTLRCPMLNRPGPRSLSGPGWYPEHWVHHAAKAGLKVRSLTRTTGMRHSEQPEWPDRTDKCVSITIVGNSCIGNADAGLVEKTRALARMAGTELVRFRFEKAASNACFLDANSCPPLDESIENAIFEYFERMGTPGSWS